MESSQLFLVPACNPQARENYSKTIENGVTLDSIKESLSPELVSTLRSKYGSDMIRVWGTMPSRRAISFWKRMRHGDRVLFYQDGKYVKCGRVVDTRRNEKLAEALWGTDAHGKTWEYLYFLNEITPLSVPKSIFNRTVGFNARFSPRGFMSVSAGTAEIIVEKFASVENLLKHLKKSSNLIDKPK